MSRRIFTPLILIPLALLCLTYASGCGLQTADASVSEATPPPAAASAPAEGPDEPVMLPAPASTPVPDNTGASAEQTPSPAPETPAPPEPEDVPKPESTPEPTAEPYDGPDLAAGEPVDDGYFDGAAFFGNSLVDGLSRYGGIKNASFYAATSASVVNVSITQNSLLESGDKATLLEAMTETDHEKIYILLGINEIGFEPEYFSQLYGTMLDSIRQAEPDSDIYIMSLSPVTQACSESSDVFNMERIGAYNDALYALAQDKQCYYVDLCAALAGEDGYLTEEDSTDGIHLKPEKYPDWAEYLRTHVKE